MMNPNNNSKLKEFVVGNKLFVNAGSEVVGMKGFTKLLLAPLILVAFIVLMMIVNNMYFDSLQKQIIFVSGLALIGFYTLYAMWR